MDDQYLRPLPVIPARQESHPSAENKIYPDRIRRRRTLLHELKVQQSRETVGDVSNSEDSQISSTSVMDQLRSRIPSYTSMFPVFKQIRHYSFGMLSADLLAGLTIAFVLIPQSIAFSGLAGVQPITALTSAVFPVLLYALFGASKHLAIGPEALSSVLVGVAIEDYIKKHGGAAMPIVAALTFLVGLFLIMLSIAQAGFIDNVLSGYLLTGFVLGVACLIMVEQLPELLGLTMEKHVGDISTFEKAKSVFHAFDTAHGATVGVGIGSFLFLVACKFAKKSLKKKYPWVTMIPEILLLVMINLILSYTLDFKSLGIRVLGEFDNKLPTPSFPILSLELINSLMSDVVTITIVGFIECQTVTRNYGLKHGYYPSGNQELFALGISNVIGSCLGAYVTFGSLPRSRIQATVGGKSNLTGVFAALFVFISFTFFASVLKFLPRAALAGVVFNAAVNLIEYHEILFMFKMRIVSDILLFFVAWFITLFLTMGDGILLCLLLAVLIILRRTTAVNLRLLGYLPNSNTVHNYVDMKEFPEAEVVDGVLIMGLKGSLCFYNAGQLRRTMEHLMKTEKRLFLEAKDMVRQPTNSSTRTLFDRSKDLFKFKKDESKQDEVLSGGSSIDADPIEMVFGLSEFDDQYDTDDRFCVILDFCNCSDVDSASVFILKRIVTNFKKEDTRILFTGVNDNFRELMRTSGLDHALGKNNLFQNIPQAIANIQNRKFSENLSPSRHSTISIL